MVVCFLWLLRSLDLLLLLLWPLALLSLKMRLLLWGGFLYLIRRRSFLRSHHASTRPLIVVEATSIVSVLWQGAHQALLVRTTDSLARLSSREAWLHRAILVWWSHRRRVILAWIWRKGTGHRIFILRVSLLLIHSLSEASLSRSWFHGRLSKRIFKSILFGHHALYHGIISRDDSFLNKVHLCRRWLRLIYSVRAARNVSLSDQLGELSIAVRTWNPIVLCLRHIIAHLDSLCVSVRVTCLLGQFHLPGNLDCLLHHVMLIAPACCIGRFPAWNFAGLAFSPVKLWSAFTLWLVIKDFPAWDKYATIAALVFINHLSRFDSAFADLCLFHASVSIRFVSGRIGIFTWIGRGKSSFKRSSCLAWSLVNIKTVGQECSPAVLASYESLCVPDFICRHADLIHLLYRISPPQLAFFNRIQFLSQQKPQVNLRSNFDYFNPNLLYLTIQVPEALAFYAFWVACSAQLPISTCMS